MKLSAPIATSEKSMKKKIAAIYARVSSQQQKDDETIDSQIDTLIRFAEREGLEVPSEWVFRDEGYSGASLDRPGLDKLRDLVQEYPLNVVLIYSPDRLSRKYALQLILEEEFRKSGVNLIFFKGKNQNETPEDHLLSHFQGIFAEYERAQILDRTRRGKLHKARQGDKRILTQAPFGYYNERNSTFYTIKESEASIVEEIFYLFTKKGLKMRQIAIQLEQKGITAPKGGINWNSKTLSGILGNPAYTGTAYFGKTEKYEGKLERTVRYKTRGKVVKAIKPKRMKPFELWEPIPVPQIINENDFEIAQELLKKNKEFASRNTKEPSLLQGLLVCGLCGNSYYKKTRQNSVNYVCRSHLTKNMIKCGNRNLNQKEMDKLIWGNVIELLKKPELIEQEISRRCDDNNHKTDQSFYKQELEKELRLLEKSHNKLLDAYQESDCLTIDELRKRSKILKERENAIRKELAGLEAYIIKKESYRDFAKTLEKFKEKLDKSYDSLPMNEKQKICRVLMEDIIIFPEEIEIRHTIPMLGSQNSPLCEALVYSP